MKTPHVLFISDEFSNNSKRCVQQGRELESRVTVYKKTDETYMLKMKASRAFFSEVDKRFQNMPFNLRMLEDEKKAKMGVVECLKHKIIEPFQVLYDKPGNFRSYYQMSHFDGNCVKLFISSYVQASLLPSSNTRCS